MAEPDVIPTSASVASTGLGIRYIGDYSFALSGLIQPVNNFGSPLTMLEFNSGSGAYITQFNFSYQTSDLGANKVIYFRLTFNGEVINQLTDYTNAAHTESLMAVQQKIIIPSYTHVLVNVGNNDTNAIDTYATIYGTKIQ